MISVINSQKPLILASKSPRRAQLFRQVGLEFRVIVSNVLESIDESVNPEQQVVVLSLSKAQDVADRIDSGLVVGADTMVVVDGKILGKPVSDDDAFKMLRSLSGKTHEVFTGFSIVDALEKKWVTDYESTKVTFRHLSDAEIEEYVLHNNCLDKAGAYGIQDRSALFVERINGCYYNVVGFPLQKFYVTLKKFACVNDGMVKTMNNEQ